MFISVPLNSAFRANPAETCGIEILTGLTWELCVERGFQTFSDNLVTSPHYSLFVTPIFILVHMYTTESLIRRQVVQASTPCAPGNETSIFITTFGSYRVCIPKPGFSCHAGDSTKRAFLAMSRVFLLCTSSARVGLCTSLCVHHFLREGLLWV